MTRRRIIAAAVVAGCAIATASSATGVLGSRNLSSSAAPAHVVVAANGHAGVFTLRDGALTRLDVQAPPGRLMIPPPAATPMATAITVGTRRVWIARGRTIFGYTTDQTNLQQVWTTTPQHLPPGKLVIASGGGWLWVADARGQQVQPINVHEPTRWTATQLTRAPAQRAAVSVSDPILSLAGVPGAVWALTTTPTGGTQLSQIFSRPGKETSRNVLQSARAPIGIASFGGILCVLVRGQILHLNATTGRILRKITVPPTMQAISVNDGHVVVSAPATGAVLDISLLDPSIHQIQSVSAPARALVATPAGFWASVGRDATPTKYVGL
jgi:hypothetical protein